MSAFSPASLKVVVPWAMRHDWPAGQKYETGALDIYTLWLMTGGEAHVAMDGAEWHIPAGSAFLCPPNRKRSVHTPRGGQWFSISLSATLFGHVDLIQLMNPPVVWQPPPGEFQALSGVLESLVREWSEGVAVAPVTPATINSYVQNRWAPGRTPGATSVLMCDCYARAAVGLCWRMLGSVELEHASDRSLPPWLSVALQKLKSEPNISVEHLARDVGVSAAQLRRQFHRWLGTSPREYLNRQRLEDARRLLETGDAPVAEIARAVGFYSVPHFNTAFKQLFGLPPAQLRRLARGETSHLD